MNAYLKKRPKSGRKFKNLAVINRLGDNFGFVLQVLNDNRSERPARTLIRKNVFTAGRRAQNSKI